MQPRLLRNEKRPYAGEILDRLSKSTQLSEIDRDRTIIAAHDSPLIRSPYLVLLVFLINEMFPVRLANN